MNDIDIGYIAGLYDGEGSYFYRTTHKRTKPYTSPTISIAMTEEFIIHWLKEKLIELGFHITCWCYQSKVKKFKPIYAININGIQTKRFFDIFGSHLKRLKIDYKASLT